MRSDRAIHVVGCHAEGEVGDVIVGGVLPPAGATMFDKMKALEADDRLRRFLICEPRGSVARHVNLLVPPTRPDCDAGVIIMEPTEYPPMSGSNLMCTVTVLLETGLVAMVEPETVLTIDTPAGPVTARAACRDGRCESVEITNVPSFVDRLDAPLEIAGRRLDHGRHRLWRHDVCERRRAGARLCHHARRGARSRAARRGDPPRLPRAL